MPVTGNTRVFAIIGDPIAQVRSPQVFAELFQARGVDAVMVPLQVGPAGLETALRGLFACRNLGGVVVTVPHKIACARLADRLGPVAELAGSVNALRRLPRRSGPYPELDGEMFDGIGFAAALDDAGFPPRGRRVLVVGAGGVGSAIGAALVRGGVGDLALFDVERGRSEGLAARLRAAASESVIRVNEEPDPTGFDIVINATPLGMGEADDLPFEPARMAPGALVADVIMKPPMTRLLELASGLGNPILEGRHMLDRQAPLIADFFGL